MVERAVVSSWRAHRVAPWFGVAVGIVLALAAGACATGTRDPFAGDHKVGTFVPDVVVGAGGPGDLDAGIDASSPIGVDALPPSSARKSLGEYCDNGLDCESTLCKPVFAGRKVCVSVCASQADCGELGTRRYCAPEKAGAISGLCVPRSPFHCATCDTDRQCGSLSERCIKRPGENLKYCYVDCALAGDAACPPEYACRNVDDGGKTRRLCVPKLGGCDDNKGGYCDRVFEPTACVRSNSAGDCIGVRTCSSDRYDTCNARIPELVGCGEKGPPGCVVKLDPAALGTVETCTSCADRCPGIDDGSGKPNCISSSVGCDYRCRDDYFDVDGDPWNGCEVRDEVSNHSEVAASMPWGPSVDWCDETVGSCPGTGWLRYRGKYPSDKRVHYPSDAKGILGRPAYLTSTSRASDCKCEDDPAIRLKVAGAAGKYQLSLYKSGFPTAPQCTVTWDGAKPPAGYVESPPKSCGSLGDKTQWYLVIEKLSGPSEAPDYSIEFHN